MLITLNERKANREAITRLQDLHDKIDVSLERGTPLPKHLTALLGQLAGTDDIDGQRRAIEALLEDTREAYMERLREAAPTSLSCFIEYMTPDEPPARHHDFMCEKLEAISKRQLMRCMISMPPGHGKALRLDTPIPTPDGWTTIGDLQVGDRVFDETGAPCNVVAKSPVFQDRECFAVTTDCGDEIVADAEHEWLVRLCGKRDVYHIKTTRYLHMRQNRGATKRPQIKRAAPLVLPDVSLPVDPYVLGFWLGDGTTAATNFTIGVQDSDWVLAEFARLGWTLHPLKCSKSLFGMNGRLPAFREIAVLNDKHIPKAYLRASAPQRLALLQGIVDSDGHVMPTGQVEVSTIKHELALNYQELVRSLGVKCSITKRRAVCYNSPEGVKDCGSAWVISFYMKDSARLPRKASLTRDNERTPGVYIDVTPATAADTVCIEVDSQSHLFLAGSSMTPTHNSKICSHYFPPWYIGNNPRHKYIQAGHSQDFVEKEFGLRTKGIIESDAYQDIFPEIKLSHESRAASMWALAGTTGRYLTRGVGQGISGFRANIAAVDDPYSSREDAESPAIRRKVFDWFMADFTTRLLPRSPLFIVATRWHPLDLCGILEEMNRQGIGLPWDVINLPAFASESNDPLGRAILEPLWPSYYSKEHLLNLQATLPPRDWNSLYMGRPVDEKGSTLQRDWMQRYDVLPTNDCNELGQVVRQRIKRVVISVDTAQKDNERADYTAITVWVEDLHKKHYLADVIRQRVEFNALIDLVENTARRWRANAILMEDKGSGTQYIQTRGKTGLAPAPVIPISTNNDSKSFRFDGVTPMIQAGEVYFPERAVWLADYEHELLQFPVCAHDDQVDSTSQYLAWVRGSRAGGTRKLHGTGNAYGSQETSESGRTARLGGHRPGKSQTDKSTPSAKIGG